MSNRLYVVKGGSTTPIYQWRQRPILLPKRSRFAQLLIKHIHLKNLHSSIRDTLVYLREKYWVIKGRQIVRSVIKSCVQCKRYEGKPFSTTMPPDLPTVRVSEDPPFTHIGLDFAGPLYIKDQLTESQCTTICLHNYNNQTIVLCI